VRDCRQQLTQELVSRLDTDHSVTVDIAMKTWWYNIRANGGFRLTVKGYQMLVQVLKLEHYRFEHATPWVFATTLLDMDRKIQSPYYIQHPTPGCKSVVVIFGSAEAVMISLYGDFKRWLDNYEP